MGKVFANRKTLCQFGFEGFVRVEALRGDRITDVPKRAGVYVVIRSSRLAPTFLLENPAFRFKGRDPTLPVPVLRSRWVKQATVVYIGKAGKRGGKATLFARVRNYMRSGQNLSSSHWGGRAIWQLVDAKNLLVAWLKTSPARARHVERRLLGAFEDEYGALPFANRTR